MSEIRWPPFIGTQRFDRCTHAFGDPRRPFQRRFRKDDEEFFAAISADLVLQSQLRPCRSRHEPQCMITDAVTELIVDQLEMVDVKHCDAQRVRIARRALALFRRNLENAAPIEDSGQFVGRCQHPQLHGARFDQQFETLTIIRCAAIGIGDQFGELRDRVIDQKCQNVGRIASIIAFHLNRKIAGGDSDQRLAQVPSIRVDIRASLSRAVVIRRSSSSAMALKKKATVSSLSRESVRGSR